MLDAASCGHLTPEQYQLLDSLYRKHKTWLSGRFAWKCGGDRQQAEGLASDTWERAIAEFARYDTSRSFGAFLWGFGSMVLKEQQSRPARCISFEDMDQPMCERYGVPGPSADGTRVRIRVREALAALPPRQAEAVRRHLMEGESLAEVAAAQGRNPSTVRSDLLRARRKLREKLGRYAGCNVSDSVRQ
jgi:RNA polymerase sigma factor (sigma-70 family)